MATITAQEIVDRAGVLIQDATNVRWPESELLDWLNDGQREIVLVRPEAHSTNTAVQLAEGTKQSIPADGISLLDIVRNMGTDGVTPGNAVRIIDREVLDAQRPDWHTEAAAASVKHYMYDGRNPKNFYVYPPQPAVSQGYVELVYASSPTDCALVDAIKVDDVYANALLDYILYRAYSKDAEYAANAPRAVGHYQAFMQSLGVKIDSIRHQDPNRTAPPYNPASSGMTKQ